VRLLGALWRALRSLVDSALPLPPDQRDEREWMPGSDREQSAARRRRLKLRLLEKRGKGGYR